MRRKRLFGQISQALSGKGERRSGRPPVETVDALKEENIRLSRAVEELSMLNELAREIGASHSSEAIMHRIIRKSLRAVNAEQAVVTLVDRRATEPMKTMVRAMVTSSEHEQFHLNQNFLGWMHINKRPLVSNHPGEDERFKGIDWDESVRSILCVPLLVKSELIGVLTAYNKRKNENFSEDDQRLLAIIALQSAQVIENARLYEEEQAYLNMQEEVRLASKIQMELLPKVPPRVAGYDIAGKTVPAQMVGGDYFDFIAMEEGRLAICLGDVSGKGLPASLLMANLQATLRSQSLLDTAVRDCIARSNKLLFRSTDPEKFATLFYGVLNPRSHELCFSNAGHTDPYLLRSRRDPVRLATGGTVLGALESFPFEEERVGLETGDVMVVFSDGVTEAIDGTEEQFGEERLLDILRQYHELSAPALIDRIIAAVGSHAGTVPQADDLTVVVVKREGA